MCDASGLDNIEIEVYLSKEMGKSLVLLKKKIKKNHYPTNREDMPSFKLVARPIPSAFTIFILLLILVTVLGQKTVPRDFTYILKCVLISPWFPRTFFPHR